MNFVIRSFTSYINKFIDNELCYSSITSGEGLVCRFRGPETVLIQTRNPESFQAWIRSMIPTK